MSDAIKLEQSVPISFRGMRLDQAASELFGDFSRSVITDEPVVVMPDILSKNESLNEKP